MPYGESAAQIKMAVSRWYEAGFRELEHDFAEADERGVDRVRKLVATRDLDSVLEDVVPGITFTREVGQEVVVLTPSVVIRPDWALADYGSALVICYPAPFETAGEEDTDARLVVLAKALGDDLRLQALRELRDGPMMPSELARRLGIPCTSIHHHLQILTHAGLVRMPVDDARWSTVELRPEGLKELSKLAGDF